MNSFTAGTSTTSSLYTAAAVSVCRHRDASAMSFWHRLFGRKPAAPLQRGLVNPPAPVQRSSTVAPQQQPQASPKPQVTTSQGIATMLKVCSNRRYRLISLNDDPSFNQAVDELTREGPAGAQALAGLIDELLATRCAEIQDVLMAAGRLSSQSELVSAIQRVVSAPPVIAGTGSGRFSQVIVGGGKIG